LQRPQCRKAFALTPKKLPDNAVAVREQVLNNLGAPYRERDAICTSRFTAPAGGVAAA
jgi:hypothetical protein